MGLFKKEEVIEKEVQGVIEGKLEVKNATTMKKKNLSLFDVDTIQYVIDKFPSMSVEIQSGLNNLANILENTIDYIEDKSSEIIKKNRDFDLSKSYRETSIAIYYVTKNIDEYVKWMQHEYEKNSNECELDVTNEKKKDIEKEDNKYLSESLLGKEGIEIYKDFSAKEPQGFKIKDDVVLVEDWDDLLVKTAEILTKKYRENKYSNTVTKEIKSVGKKSTQNSLRDTAIEMLNEYKINLDEFKIVVK